MKKCLFLTLMLTVLSGCVGVIIPEKVVYNNQFPFENGKYEFSQKELEVIKSNKAEGFVLIKDKSEWCGVTIAALIAPIPLKLPVCKTGKAVKFSNSIPTHVADKHIKTRMYACGPGFMVMTWMAHPYPDNHYFLMGFCGSLPDT